MKAVVIFGTGDIAQVAAYYLAHDGGREVACFTVDRDYIATNEFCARPVVPFEAVSEQYPPSDYDMLVAIGYANVNQIRAAKYQQAKDKGYCLCSYISPLASVATNAVIGENCFILEHNTLQPYVTIGNNVTLWSGNHIGHHVSIADHCFISSHVVVSGGVTIEESCFIGVNATIRDHVVIGARNVIGAGALMLGNTEPDGVYIGNATERSRIPSMRLKKI